MQPLLIHFGLLGVSSAIGAVAYFLVRKDKPGYVVLLRLETGLFCLVSLFTCGPWLIMIALVPLVMLGGVSLFGAWAHRQLTGQSVIGKKESWLLILTSAIFSLYLGTAPGILVIDSIKACFSPNYAEALLTIYWLLLAITPVLTPFLLWTAENMKLRPGMDKHFED